MEKNQTLENKTSFIHTTNAHLKNPFMACWYKLFAVGAIKVIKTDIEWNLRFSGTCERTTWSCKYDTTLHNTCTHLKQKWVDSQGGKGAPKMALDSYM